MHSEFPDCSSHIYSGGTRLFNWIPIIAHRLEKKHSLELCENNTD